MKGDKAIIGIVVILTMILMGGTVGMATSYFLMTNAVASESEAEKFKTLEQELKQTAMESEQPEQMKNEVTGVSEISNDEKEKIDTENMGDIQQTLNVWKEIMFQAAQGSLSHKDAGQLLYSLSSEVYQRNLPEAYSLLRLKSVIKHSKDQENPLVDVQFSQIIYEREDMASVEVIEVYGKATEHYRLKLHKENGQWRFAVQIFE